MVPRSTLADVTFELLVSSSIGRYRRVAGAAGNAFHEAMHRRSGDWSEVLDRARTLVAMIAERPQRDEAEAELVILLDAAARTALPQVDALLADAATSDSPSLVWISAFARHLIAERPISITRGLRLPRRPRRSAISSPVDTTKYAS